MKIFISFLQSKVQHPIAAYGFWEYYIKNGIEEAGHQWIEDENIDWAEGLVPQTPEDLSHWKSVTWQKTLDHLHKSRPAVFLSYLYPQQIDEQAILAIRKMGIYCVNFFCDNVRLFQKVPNAYHVFDLNWVPEYQAIKMYQLAKINHIHLPMPMWVLPKYRTPSDLENERISFIGSRDIQRTLLFNQLADQKTINQLDVYGSGWLDNGQSSMGVTPTPSIFKTLTNQISFIGKNGMAAYLNKLNSFRKKDEISELLKIHIRSKPNFIDYINITRDSQITLGVSRYPSFHFPVQNPNTYSRLRDLEAPMLGACYLTEYSSGLNQMYDIGKEIETYKNVDELMMKIMYLKKDKELRNKLRINGQKRALADNSILQSIAKIEQFMAKNNHA